MELNTLADVKLTGRALINGWLDKHPEKRDAAIASMFDVINNGQDDEVRIKAFQALVQADQADLKRTEVALKKQALDDAKRFRLLELLRHLPPGELAKITAANAGDSDSGRAEPTTRPNGEAAGV